MNLPAWKFLSDDQRERIVASLYTAVKHDEEMAENVYNTIRHVVIPYSNLCKTPQTPSPESRER